MELHCVRGSVDLEVLGSPKDLANREAGASLGGVLKPVPAWGAFQPVCCALYAVCMRVGGCGSKASLFAELSVAGGPMRPSICHD